MDEVRHADASTAAAPYDAKRALREHFPEMSRYAKRIDRSIESIAADLSRREWEGEDTSFARTILLELRWRTNATADVEAAKEAHRRLVQAAADPEAANASTQDAEGSFGSGTDVWFLKIDRSTDQLLARQWPWRIAPYFLERVDDPVRMYTYLEGLAWCDVARRGTDTRKELNLSISVIARLAMRGGQAGYLAGPGIIPALEAFVKGWRDPESGFFGVKYVVDDQGNEATTRDLSLTFHMTRYLPHLVEDWPRLIDTLLDLSETRYPQGRVDGGKKQYSDHNNYDVAEILMRGWRRMHPRQRVRAAELIGAMFDWCVTHSVTPDGEVIEPDTGDMVPDAYYFGAAFLDTVGYFDRNKRFWTDKNLGDPDRIRTGMTRRLARFNPRLTVVADARERLGVQDRPASHAVI